MKNIDKIEEILENCSFETIENDFRKNGFECVEEIETEDEIEGFSTTVDWSSSFEVSKDSEKFLIYVSGKAIAEISYERWTETYGYYIDYHSVEKIKEECE